MGDSNTRYADIIIDISHEALDRVFQYRVPLSLWKEVRPGSRVFVPFGRGELGLTKISDEYRNEIIFKRALMEAKIIKNSRYNYEVPLRFFLLIIFEKNLLSNNAFL